MSVALVTPRYARDADRFRHRGQVRICSQPRVPRENEKTLVLRHIVFFVRRHVGHPAHNGRILHGLNYEAPMTLEPAMRAAAEETGVASQSWDVT